MKSMGYDFNKPFKKCRCGAKRFIVGENRKMICYYCHSMAEMTESYKKKINKKK